MATYKRFEDLPVWKKAADLAAKMFAWTAHPSFRGKGDLANQLQRATLSISNNIAEGFERGSTRELLQYLYIARGSAGEVRSMLCVMQRMDAFDELSTDVDQLRGVAENISRQIHGWASSLQNSDIEGAKFLNDDAKHRYDREQRRNEFLKQQAENRAELEERLKKRAQERAAE